MISVVIPTLNEAAGLGGLLLALAAESTAHEVIVADGGSNDGTAALALSRGAAVVHCGRGRGIQLRHGARAARGGTLLFLHADTGFPAGGLARIEAALAQSPELVGGNFRLIFDGGGAFSDWLTGFYAWFRGHGLYYGDSGIFVRRSVYDAIGGMRPYAVMEDYDFSRRLERAGPSLCIAEPPLTTSSRKFHGRSAPEIVWGWLKLHLLFHLGVAPERLARMYYGKRLSPEAHPSGHGPRRRREW